MIARVKEMSSARGRKNSGTGRSLSIWPPEKLPKQIKMVGPLPPKYDQTKVSTMPWSARNTYIVLW